MTLVASLALTIGLILLLREIMRVIQTRNLVAEAEKSLAGECL